MSYGHFACDQPLISRVIAPRYGWWYRPDLTGHDRAIVEQVTRAQRRRKSGRSESGGSGLTARRGAVEAAVASVAAAASNGCRLVGNDQFTGLDNGISRADRVVVYRDGHDDQAGAHRHAGADHRPERQSRGGCSRGALSAASQLDGSHFIDATLNAGNAHPPVDSQSVREFERAYFRHSGLKPKPASSSP